MRLFHIPKWLLEERFDLEYVPKVGLDQGGRFRVGIFDVRRETSVGYGKSISAAAKKALKAREDAG